MQISVTIQEWLYRMFVNGFSAFEFLLLRATFKLHLQNTYQLRDQLKTFYEQ
jgi:hypothetical protein